MMSFFRSQMTGILQPFAENVEELHKMVFSMTETMREFRTRVDSNASEIKGHAAVLASLRSDLDESKEQAKSVQELLDTTIASTKDFDSATSNLKALSKQTLEKVDTINVLMTRSLEELKIEFDKSDRDILRRTEKIIEDVREEIRGNSESIGRLQTSLISLEGLHGKTVETINQNKLAFDNHVPKYDTLQQELKEHCAKFDSFDQEAQKQYRELDNKIVQARARMMQHREETNQTHNAAVHELSARLDTHDKASAKALEKFAQIDACLTTQQSLIVQHGENMSKLVKTIDKKHISDIEAIRKEGEAAQVDISRNSRLVGELRVIIYGQHPDSDGKNCVHELQEDMTLAMRRAARLEQILGLDPLTKDSPDDNNLTLRNGILLTKEQIEMFEKTFSRFDSDGSGSISTTEVSSVLKDLGHEVSLDVVTLIVKEIDNDGSGEISCDEFCSLMSKILGPDGKVDVDGYLAQMSQTAQENAQREAKQNQVVELLPILKEEVEHHSTLIKQEKTKLLGTCERIQSLEGDHAALVLEVQKLRKGLNANNEYWKGLSQGLKETKKSVHKEGEGEMLPSATKLRNLPPLDGRPNTHPGAGLLS